MDPAPNCNPLARKHQLPDQHASPRSASFKSWGNSVLGTPTTHRISPRIQEKGSGTTRITTPQVSVLLLSAGHWAHEPLHLAAVSAPEGHSASASCSRSALLDLTRSASWGGSQVIESYPKLSHESPSWSSVEVRVMMWLKKSSMGFCFKGLTRDRGPWASGLLTVQPLQLQVCRL